MTTGLYPFFLTFFLSDKADLSEGCVRLKIVLIYNTEHQDKRENSKKGKE